jgi:hypothetical protein
MVCARGVKSGAASTVSLKNTYVPELFSRE